MGSSVAVVGARTCSPGGAETASGLGRALAACGATVVSGGARGIDSAAHRGAVDVGGSTVAVLGCGIDVPYPRQNRRLFDAILANGSIVSEYPPGTRAEPFRFPARNRIVAALSRAVVVVEGADGSGAMIEERLIQGLAEAGLAAFGSQGFWKRGARSAERGTVSILACAPRSALRAPRSGCRLPRPSALPALPAPAADLVTRAAARGNRFDAQAIP